MLALIALLVAVPASVDGQQRVTLLAGSTEDWLGFHRGVRDPMEPEAERRLPVVRAVYPCSPAHLAGLEPGDLLIAVDGEDARRPAPFGGPLGSEYDVVLDCAGERLTVKLVRAKRPDEVGEPVTEAPVGSPAEWKCPDQGSGEMVGSRRGRHPPGYGERIVELVRSGLS